MAANSLIPGAILTGDLIGSTKAGPKAVESAMAVLADACTEMDRWPEAAPTRFTRYRGDGWQAAITPSHRALRASLYLFARLRAANTGLATRIGLGLGQIDREGSLSEAHGAAFEASGHALESLGRGERLALASENIASLEEAILTLIDERTSRWSREQAEAMAIHLPPGNGKTLATIAEKLGVSVQAAHSRLTSAGYQAIGKAIVSWEISFSQGGIKWRT
jgi:hypothetical protein